MSLRSKLRPRLVCTGAVVALAALPLAGCTEVETESSTSYSPSKLTELKGQDDLKLVTFTAEGARRTGIEMSPIRADGGRKVVPYAALIYDPEGKTFVYTSPKPLTFLRKPVKVVRVEGQRVIVSAGPPAGTEVVTVGTAEVYGTELEVESH